MIKEILLILVFLLIIPNSYAFVINEIMYNPEGDDNNNEYLEIILDSYINLSGYKIQDSISEDSLQELQYVNNNFALIVEEGFNFTGINSSVYSVGATIGNNLNNDNDLVILKDSNDSILNAVSYSNSWGADGNGKSLCRLPDEEGLWKECVKTPGKANSDEDQIGYNVVKINEFLPDPNGDDDAPMPNGEWIEFFNDDDQDLDLSGLIIKDNSGKSLEIADSNTLSGTIIKANSYLVVYMNGLFGFLNNDGFEKIQFYNNNNLIEEVSYSDSEQGASWAKVNGLWVKNTPTAGGSNIYTNDSYRAELKILDVDLGRDDKAKFGDIIKVKISINKGNSTKNALSLFVEGAKEISKKTKFNVYDNYIENIITLPIQLFPNCDNKFQNGEYKVVLEGLDDSDREEIEIEGNNDDLCIIEKVKEEVKENKGSKETAKEVKAKTEKQKVTEDVAPVIAAVVYESSGLKAQRNAMWFLNLLLISLFVVLFWVKSK
ncbi:MAG: lamin tail domain-containing protein [Candidatus Woesearchaeota archaeon]|nr:MAG: lamin tail domain-containing protein [Candidatus Woesearchaeota archaeon]